MEAPVYSVSLSYSGEEGHGTIMLAEQGDIKDKLTNTQCFGNDIHYNILFQGRAAALLGSDLNKFSVS